MRSPKCGDASNRSTSLENASGAEFATKSSTACGVGGTPSSTSVARRIKAGQVGVNRYLGSAPGTPWVGARQSGFGFLGGVDGHRQFTTPKSISRAMPKVPEGVE